MLTQDELNDLQPILNAQYNIVNKFKKKVEEIETSFSTNGDTALEIASVQNLINELLEDIHLLSDTDIENAQLEAEGINSIYERKRNAINEKLVKINFTNWDEYVAECYKYSLRNEIDPFAPYEMFLTKADFEIINNEKFSRQFKWDKWDYMFVGFAGFIAALTDIFIVAIPKDDNFKTSIYKGQKGSPLTKWLQSLRLPDGLQRWLEENAKVSYDNTGGSLHRVDTIGHDLILGFIFGIIDIYRGTATQIKDGNIIIEKLTDGKNLLESIIKQFLHICSDIFTPRGIPVPFASVFKLLDIGEFKRSNGKTATISDLVTWMYSQGYDLRHFITMSVTPATIEIILRMYIMIRHYIENDDVVFKVASSPKYRSMLLSSHAVACAANVGKVYLRKGNPLAINYAEWLMLIRYLVPSVKYWLFERSEVELQYLENVNESIWDELLVNSDILLQKSKFENIEPITLGIT